MRIHVRHETTYRYDRAVDSTAQLVRMMPRDHAGQRVLAWRVVEAPDRVPPQIEDGYGNLVHMLTLNRQHLGATICAEGVVETSDTNGIVRDAVERLPPAFFLRQTDATEPDEAIAALAAEVAGIGDAVERMHGLMGLIRERMAYEVGATVARTSAAEALSQGRGVCQDYAQIFLGAARRLDTPARYVSGYLWENRDGTPGEAGHAWVEAHIDKLGWVGFDPTNGVSPTEAHVRVAIGLDYLEALPVRGVRRGAAAESLTVSVEVTQTQGQSQNQSQQ
jgi:transglutaminase-like putative cysteine protease